MREGEWLPVRTSARVPIRRRIGWTIYLLPLAPSALLYFASVFAIVESGESSNLIVVVVALIALLLTGHFYRRERWFQSMAIRDDEAAMLYEIDVREAVLVKVRFLRGRAITGNDRGAMWIEEGRLVFSGSQTSFDLPRTHVEVPASPRKGRGTELRLKRNPSVGEVRLSIEPLVGDRPFMKPIRLSIEEWLNRPSDSSKDGQWPPLETGPGSLSIERIWGRRIALRCATALAVYFAVFPFAMVLKLATPFSVLCVTGLFMTTGLPWLIERCVDRRKALERQ